MFCALDRTFCASPNCDNSCGHKISERQKEIIEADPMLSNNISYTNFCDHIEVELCLEKTDVFNAKN